MKRFFYFLMCAFALLTSCGKTVKEPVAEPVKPSFNEVLNAEYKDLLDTAPETKFYESQITLDTACKDSLVILKFIDVYQLNDWSKQIIHEGDSVSVITKNDYWLEDVQFDPDTLNLTLEGAYERLQESNVVKPAYIHFVVLRCPLGPTRVNPMYIFGQNKQFVAVDAVTGDVKEYN